MKFLITVSIPFWDKGQVSIPQSEVEKSIEYCSEYEEVAPNL